MTCCPSFEEAVKEGWIEDHHGNWCVPNAWCWRTLIYCPFCGQRIESAEKASAPAGDAKT